MSSPQFTLEDAAKKILSEKNIHFDDAEIEAEAVFDLVQRMTDRIDAEILGTFNDVQRAAFDILVQNNAPADQMQTFIASEVPHLSDIVAAAVIDVRNLYLAQ